jgi:hypothetical protein
MATQYVLFPTLAEAQTYSAANWEIVLGRPKKPEDVSTYLWPIMTNSATDESMCVVTDDLYAQVYPKLQPEDQAALDAALVPESDPGVQAILDAQPKPPPMGADAK